MKQIIILVLLAFVLAMPLALAEENVSANVSSDATPVLISEDVSNVTDVEADLNEADNVGALGMGLKKMGLWFTFNQEKKAEKELQLAKLQLIRAKIAAKNNDSAAMEKALEAHQALIEKVQVRMDKMQNKSKGLDRAIEVHEARIAKLNLALLNANLTNEQRQGVEEIISKLENVTSHLRGVETRIENKSESIRERANSSGEKGDKVRERVRNESLVENASD